MSKIKELVAERLSILSVPPQPKPKPSYHLFVVESRDWVAVYLEYWTGPLFRKYMRHHFSWNANTVKLKLLKEGHYIEADEW